MFINMIIMKYVHDAFLNSGSEFVINIHAFYQWYDMYHSFSYLSRSLVSWLEQVYQTLKHYSIRYYYYYLMLMVVSP